MKWSVRLFARLFMALAAGALVAAAPEHLCNGQDVMPMPDGRLLGHIPYGQANPAELISAPPGFALGQPCLMQREAMTDLVRLLDAAKGVPGVANRLRGVSCFRTIEHQRAVFCSQIGPHKRCRNAAERARSVGPPGFSEHATGFALDFGIRPLEGRCGDVSDCIALTPPGRWLLAHGPEFGFELSFPPGNAQGVTWEPWHWRWVGIHAGIPGAGHARSLFARARGQFPASPAILDLPAPWPGAPIAPGPGVVPLKPTPTPTPHVLAPGAVLWPTMPAS